MAPFTQTLASYRADTQRLLRDSTAQLYAVVDLNAFINRAIGQRDLDLRINRLKYSFQVTTSVFSYSITTITTSGTLMTGTSTVTPVDALSVVVIPIGGANSGVRYPLARWPYSRLSFLLSTAYPTYPVAYAMYNPATFMLGPPPAGAYFTEFDLFGYNPQLANDNDADPIPYPWTDPVPFLAASFAKSSAQRFDEAAAFEKQYYQRLMHIAGTSRPMAIPNPWFDLGYAR